MLRKKNILELPFVYTANVVYLGNKLFVAAGSERGYPAYLVDPGDGSIMKVADGPGGMMCLMAMPGNTDHLFSVMGLFPPFVGSDAGVYHHVHTGNSWKTEKIVTLPFAHRCEILQVKGKNHLFISSVSLRKDDPSDWSRAGEVHHIMPDNLNDLNDRTSVIIDNLFKNHGMAKAKIDGVESVCVSGAEGIFAIRPDNNNGWEIRQLFDTEVSEFVFFDLNGDGHDELITIEPFHGNEVCIYKKTGNSWQKLYSNNLSFGHGLDTGMFNGRPVITVGNRQGSGALEMHIVNSLDNIEKTIVEENAGPTQTKVFHFRDVDYILSANQAKNEIALYY